MDTLRVAGKHDQASWWCEYTIKSKFANRPENAEILSTAFVVLGLSYLDRDLKNYSETEHCFLEGLRLTRSFELLQKDNSQKAAIQIWKARIYNNLGILESARNDFVKAIAYFNGSLKIKHKYHEETGIAQTQANLAKVYFASSNFRQGLGSLRSVVALMEKSPSAYICFDTTVEVLRLAAPGFRFRLPISVSAVATARFWGRVERYFKMKKGKIAVVLPELRNLHKILTVVNVS
jgi:tetratricopeptide (TPR) repeat protein